MFDDETLHALKTLGDMENEKKIDPSQEKDGADKKQIITEKTKNAAQGETKTETCCRSCIPLDILFDILSRLPAKSIAKVRCVCKQWLSLTHDPRFLKSQRERSSSYAIMNVYVDRGVMNLYDFSVGDGKNSTEISYRLNLGRNCQLSNFVDGLTCAYSFNGTYKSMCLVNPANREHEYLPMKKSFQQSCTPESIALGIDMTTGQYKIVRLFSCFGILDLRCAIYNVGTGQWRYLGKAPFDVQISGPVFLHGALHWIGHLPNRLERILSVFRFNIKEEKFGAAISLPYSSSSKMSCVCLTESAEKLWFAFHNNIEEIFEIWTMKDYLNNIWIKEYKFDINSLSRSLQRLCSFVGIVDGEVLLKFNELGKWRVIRYNPHNGVFHKLVDLGVSFGELAIYRASLVSPRKVLKVS